MEKLDVRVFYLFYHIIELTGFLFYSPACICVFTKRGFKWFIINLLSMDFLFPYVELLNLL